MKAESSSRLPASHDTLFQKCSVITLLPLFMIVLIVVLRQSMFADIHNQAILVQIQYCKKIGVREGHCQQWKIRITHECNTINTVYFALTQICIEESASMNQNLKGYMFARKFKALYIDECFGYLHGQTPRVWSKAQDQESTDQKPFPLKSL